MFFHKTHQKTPHANALRSCPLPGCTKEGNAESFTRSSHSYLCSISPGGIKNPDTTILPTLFHQDPRYFYKGTGSNTSRALYAISRTFVTRGDTGQQEINYSRLLGGFASGALSNAYHDSQDRGVGLTLRNASIGIGGNIGNNLLREFLFKRFTKTPNYDTP